MSIKKISVISRNPDHYMRETKRDIHRVQRNYDPSLHPFQAAREYKLALNATKLERVFAKPFLGSLTHSEAVSAMCKHPYRLSCIFAGTVEGEVCLWDLQNRKKMWSTQAHEGQVWCIASDPAGNSFYTVGSDQTIKRWDLEKLDDKCEEPQSTWLCNNVVTGISSHQRRNEFVTCGERVLLWDASAKAPKSSFDWSTSGWGNEASVICVKFNPVETDLFASSDNANNVVLYDIRAKEVKKIKMKMKINSLVWNPMEAFILTAAGEDYNCYSFDIRKMDSDDCIIGLHRGHTSAVVDVDYSPTGKEFCCGSYDKSIRIFRVDERTSRDVYHTRRMFRVNCVLWSGDNKYILSGSTDHNLRLWKAAASEKLGIMSGREKLAIDYGNELKAKYASYPEIKKIAKHRHLPKHIYNAKKEQHTSRESRARKEANLRKHSKPGTVPFIPLCKRAVVGPVDEDLEDEKDVGDESE